MRRVISTIGTLGVLLTGAKRRLVNPELAFKKWILETTFRATPEIKERFLACYKDLSK
jgi:hypothetical protein